MTEKKLSDDELVDADRKAYRARFIWGPIFALYGFVAAVGSVYAIHIGLLPKAWMNGNRPIVIMAAVLVLALPAIVFLARRYRVPKAARRAPVQRKLIEDHQRRARFAVWVYLFVVPIEAAAVIAIDIDHGGHYVWPADFLMPFWFVIFALLGVYVVLRGPAPADEWTRSIRSDAARVGFVSAILGFGAVYLLSLAHADWVRLATPGVIALAVMAAVIHFLIADWRAGR